MDRSYGEGRSWRDNTCFEGDHWSTVAQWKRMSDTPAQQFSNAILGNDFSIVEKYVENKGNLEILFGLWIK